MEKSKYNDNKLAEELDVIVLTDDRHKKDGFPCGTIGTLIRAYTGKDVPMYAQFFRGGKGSVRPLSLLGFRVLDERVERDLRLILSFFHAKTKTRAE